MTGGLVVDVGANIGLFTLYAVRRWRPSRVLAIEPAPPLLDLLGRNLTAHGLAQVEVVPAALSDSAGDRELTYFPAAPGNSTLRPADKDADLAALPPRARRSATALMEDRVGYPVPVTTLTSVLDRYAPERVDFCKLDVEGEELAILRGVSDTWWNRIVTVVVEVSQQSAAVDDVTGLLAEHGFTVHIEDADPSRTMNALVWGTRDERRPA